MYNPYDFQRYPKRKSPRLQGYDYSENGYYFVTICTHEKKCIFGKPNDLNELGIIVLQGILKIPEHYPQVAIDKFVVMPNHVHLLIYLESGNADLKTVIGSWKAHITREIRKIEPDMIVWQKSFHDHIIRNEKSYQNIWLYIENNPINWEKDCFYAE